MHLCSLNNYSHGTKLVAIYIARQLTSSTLFQFPDRAIYALSLKILRLKLSYIA